MEQDEPTVSNVTINDSVDFSTDDFDKLLKPPRNNFHSYLNEDVSVRFPRTRTNHNATLSSASECTNHMSFTRLSSEAILPGAMNYLSANYESLDYDTCENQLLLDEERKKGYKFVVKKNVARWFIFLLIGIFTALIACFVDISISEASKLKYNSLKKCIDQCISQNCLWLPYLLWLVMNLVPVLIGSILVAYVEPVAAGSGIPQIKCYLNGVKVPRVVRIKTLVVKMIGVICTVVGGLAGGKEGPMIHSGAVVAAGISQGKSTTFKKDFGIFKYFREDHEKRDFVSGGAASGVSAAFGAPIGGVLFSIEEGTSFFKQSLTWRTFFASMITTFTMNIILSAYHGHPGELSYPGLINLGKFDEIPYQFYEIPLFMIIGTLGGVLGALWNHVNYKISCFRLRFIKTNWIKVLEALFIAVLSATLGFLMIYFIDDCKSTEEFSMDFPIQMYCEDGKYSAVAALWFQTPESSVNSLFHDSKGSQNDETLVIFVILYFLLAACTFGLSMSSGLFIPSLLIGAAWGRLVGSGLSKLWPNCEIFDPRKYALLGAAAQLGGVVRMTISLTVILIEATDGIFFGLPLIIVLLMAKWVGDFFNEGIYDIHIQMTGVPILPWEPPPLSNNIYASEIMSHPVVTLKTVENVGHIVELLKCVSFNGFPVVDPPTSDQEEINSYGRFRGLILRSQLIVLLQNKIYNEYSEYWDEFLNIEMFRSEYPRYSTIDHVNVTADEKTYNMDLRPFMNPSPYTVQHSATLPRVFRLFRALGLRHLPIVNDTNEVIGMVTRKDIARFRIWRHQGRMGLDELLISDKL
ncbi:H(+)/Cl(-) exchange transporter 7 isoform X1 [Neodiprion virginianus]|uniref:H(+)/Cl(-) exchange transporter 7 isoform X1 n=1 Tax=Neodiprion virginianus TaxID=2961670 RepID=UPI001EE6E73A|nr:H(+)/Cl(-) exchange transporter 7 isoform X1 [Neodiprion virginianus]XP_046616600.1 H(+)/Cl(-) exchange transporter 7 isoform X1 [Neodiprion virginianus]